MALKAASKTCARFLPPGLKRLGKLSPDGSTFTGNFGFSAILVGYLPLPARPVNKDGEKGARRTSGYTDGPAVFWEPADTPVVACCPRAAAGLWVSHHHCAGTTAVRDAGGKRQRHRADTNGGRGTTADHYEHPRAAREPGADSRRAPAGLGGAVCRNLCCPAQTAATVSQSGGC